MELILLEKIENLGDIGEKVRVKAGYGRNFLLPQGKAAVATADNVAKFEAMRTQLEQRAAEVLATAQARAAKLEGLQISITSKAGSEGKLFGSIGTADIAEAVTQMGFEVDRSELRLPDGPLRMIGEHQVELHLHTDVDVPLTVHILEEE